jgi:hypothetical protein
MPPDARPIIARFAARSSPDLPPDSSPDSPPDSSPDLPPYREPAFEDNVYIKK